VLAAARHAQSIGQRDPMPPFRAPEPDSQRWIQVRAYLTDQCGIPSQWIDYLHDRGTIYADRRANAVFVQHNDQGEATGAFLHGTSEERPFQGLAPGTRRDAGCFQVTLSATQNAGRACPTLIIAESPIEALSVLEIYRRGQESKEHGPVTVLSMDGAGTFPQQRARETLERGGVVHVATKENQVCERAWQELREQYPTQVRRDRPARQEVLGDSRTTQPSRTPGREIASVRLPEAEEGQ